MNNPFEGKAVKFDTAEQLEHLAELARGYGLEVSRINYNEYDIYFRNTNNTDKPHYTNCWKTKGLPEIHYSDFTKAIEAIPIHFEQPDPIARPEQPDMVNQPPHYTVNGIEVIDVIEGYGLCYLLGNVIKYVLRANRKGNKKQDLQKAAWYLNRAISKLE